MYACFEQPDLKARFAISVVAPEAWTVVSNGAGGRNRRGRRRLDTDQIRRNAADLHLPDRSGRRRLPQRATAATTAAAGTIPMAIFCRQSLAAHLDADEIFAITASGFEVFEQQFGVPYPFGKYDQVFVPEYNGGAMENVGCVTLRDEYLFRSKVTAASLDYRRDTILHELSHMWFGDLVTMRWWDDLWLKESFATWVSNFAVSRAGRRSRAPGRRSAAAPRPWPTGRTSCPRPIRSPPTSSTWRRSSTTSTRSPTPRAPSVLVQLVAFVGPGRVPGRRAGVLRHARVRQHRADRPAAGLQRASGRDLSRWSAQWLETAGVNTLRLELAADEPD